MIERVIKGESLPYINLNQIKSSQNKMFNMIKKHFEIVEEVFGITIPDTELAYIIEMIDTNFGTLRLSI
ncbi:PRD domain-containing protein [Thermohydrogenium kirishiense]|nr:PRD domain-containing protein [Thermohydrogenium kirishiense]